MFNLSGSEIVVILLLALVVLGPEKLPDAIRRAGRTYAELKKMGNSFQSEMRSVLDEPMQEMRETADLLRQSVDFTEGEMTGGAGKAAGTSAGAASAAGPVSAPAPAPRPLTADPPPPATSSPTPDAPAAVDTPPTGDRSTATPTDATAAGPPADEALINRTLSGGQ